MSGPLYSWLSFTGKIFNTTEKIQRACCAVAPLIQREEFHNMSVDHTAQNVSVHHVINSFEIETHTAVQFTPNLTTDVNLMSLTRLPLAHQIIIINGPFVKVLNSIETIFNFYYIFKSWILGFSCWIIHSNAHWWSCSDWLSAFKCRI